MIRQNWLKRLSVLVAFSVWMAPERLKAQTRYCDPKDPTNCSQAVTEGQTVPFSGQLLSHKRAAKLVVSTEKCFELKKLDMEEAKELFQLKYNFLERTHANEKQMLEAQNRLLTESLEERAKWYEHPIFISGSSVLATILVFSGAVKVLELLNK